MSEATPPLAARQNGHAVAEPGKYLTFKLGHESYGIPVLKVREIIRLCPITLVANMPAHVKGVINLRGKVIPLVDLRTKFGLPVTLDNERTCIVVTQIASASGGARLYGIIVDGVEEVAHFTDADLEPTPDFGGAIDAQFITGMAKASAGVKMLVDLDRIWAADCAALPDPRPPQPE
ncbi:MAG: purine-binding chemotaxis protein CheW [Planctomycetota bacterium]|nr:MAG: purine-binding chemotaxis protein CheW [Planctomycetota bacterium]